ncbi:hypothetical protein GPECTOR_41g727 [Gonium pectorale]|uniref:UDENN domain-containing protein n=1 Tax=Gonium pectorale TaxID=33097 RepID=A0A150GA97_GONPE|nr:hypothetical protein GPECTOR_41g727 [Gonium pectorale]|eukprot:KXZ46762.1 hypothetical protein GPECTOR_41g727 [Gonium pectorale]
MSHQFSPRKALDALYNHPMIHPGEQLLLRFGGVATIGFVRPALGRRFTVVGPPRALGAYAEAELAEGLQGWATAVLCRSLSLDNILLLLTASLLERQLVVFCPSLSTLSGVVLGLLPLLRPFSWQSLLLPVTPASMLGFLEAPVPFVLGVQYKTGDVMARALRSLTPAESAAAAAFLSATASHLSSLCGDLRPHVITHVDATARTGVLMKDSLLEAVPPRDRPFVRQFLETQMFEVWSDELISAHFEGMAA